MKKIAILGSEDSMLFEAIATFFSQHNIPVELTCLYNKLGSEIAHKAASMQVKSRYLPNEQMETYLSENTYDLIALTQYDGEIKKELIENHRFINLHNSLLPAFNGKDEIQQAIQAGVRVTGVTVYEYTQNSPYIIAQYPIMIDNTDHYEDIKEKLEHISTVLYPIVINSILEDRVFDFGDLFHSHSCSGNCGGNCSKCH